MTTQEEINKYLTEAMDECWHEYDITSPERTENWDGFATNYSGHWNDCTKCGENHIEIVRDNNFFTWDGFGKLWEWSITQAWWYQFLGTWHCPDLYPENSTIKERYVGAYLINPEQLAAAVYEFLRIV